MPISKRNYTIASGLLAATIGGKRTRLTLRLLLGISRLQLNGRNWTAKLTLHGMSSIGSFAEGPPIAPEPN